MEFCVIEYDEEGNVVDVYVPLNVTGDRETAVNKLCELVAEHTGQDDYMADEEIDDLKAGKEDMYGCEDGWGWEIKTVKEM